MNHHGPEEDDLVACEACRLWTKKEEKQQPLLIMEEVQAEFAGAQGAKHAFLSFSGDRQSCKVEIRRRKKIKSNLIK